MYIPVMAHCNASCYDILLYTYIYIYIYIYVTFYFYFEISLYTLFINFIIYAFHSSALHFFSFNDPLKRKYTSKKSCLNIWISYGFQVVRKTAECMDIVIRGLNV